MVGIVSSAGVVQGVFNYSYNLWSPYGLAVTGGGRVFVSELDFGQVLAFNEQGTLSSILSPQSAGVWPWTLAYSSKLNVLLAPDWLGNRVVSFPISPVANIPTGGASQATQPTMILLGVIAGLVLLVL